LPEAIADQHHALTARPVLLRREVAAKLRLQSERRQQFGGGMKRDDLFGIALTRERERIARRERHRTEHLLALLHFLESRIREPDAKQVVLLVRRAQSHEPVRLLVGERLQEHRVDDAEQRDVRADAERQAEYRYEREARRFDQLAAGIAQVVHAPILPHPPSLRERFELRREWLA
jgi:hypothetical protein